MLAHPSHWIALGFGSGLFPIAPGTCGTLFGWLLFDLGQPALSFWGSWLTLLVSLVVGTWACEKTGRDLGSPDHGAMVWDEIVAIWLVLLCAPPGWAWQCVGFILFRLFDIVKPPPIRFVDRRWKGGMGVMADDLVAAFFTLLVMALLKRLVPVAALEVLHLS
ncbi:MAG: phosphatidylglycerophosphatase A [Burkholderiaceae bacterium]|jgi:phosphatidylglycerophosphatase A